MSSTAVHVATEHVHHFGAKLYGYLHPPVTGKQVHILSKEKMTHLILIGLYWFSVNSSSSEGAYSVELWISRNSDPTKLVKRVNLTCTNEVQNL